jgi:hypothetical protein
MEYVGGGIFFDVFFAFALLETGKLPDFFFSPSCLLSFPCSFDIPFFFSRSLASSPREYISLDPPDEVDLMPKGGGLKSSAFASSLD